MISEKVTLAAVLLILVATACSCAGSARSAATGPESASPTTAAASVACHDDVFLSASGKPIDTVPHCELTGFGQQSR